MTGRLVSIFVAPSAGAPVESVTSARALSGRGLEGDRYGTGVGSFNRWPGRGRDLSLIALEDLEAARDGFGVSVLEGEHRRNLVVEGVDLEALLGVPFTIGGVALEGVRRCAPCKYLVRVTGQDEIFQALVRRGGLRASIVSDGVLEVGDAVTWDPADVAKRARLPR
ncbi:MOSC domain-containing protein [Rubrivirga sp.]|uniref:MOSC domain-containing protein n=1 Tax=Rubrivirga sp. TaxID=1885344 RepID=UPI003C71D86C